MVHNLGPEVVSAAFQNCVDLERFVVGRSDLKVDHTDLISRVLESSPSTGDNVKFVF